MTLNKTFLAAVDPASRAVNNLSMSADAEFRRLEERISALEERESPFFQSHVHSYAVAQSISVTSPGWANLCNLSIHRTHGIGDHYMVVAVVNIDLPAAGTYEMRLTNGTDTLYAAVDLERAGHGTEVLVGVDKPPLGTPLVYSVDVRRAAGSGGITYHGHAMYTIRGWSEEE